MAARRAGASLGSQGVRATSRSTSSKPAARRAFRRVAIVIDDFRIDYELFSETLPDEYFPKRRQLADAGSVRSAALCGWRSSICASIRGGICFCIDLDPRWVVKLIKKGWMEHLEAYKKHCIDQAITDV